VNCVELQSHALDSGSGGMAKPESRRRHAAQRPFRLCPDETHRLFEHRGAHGAFLTASHDRPPTVGFDQDRYASRIPLAARIWRVTGTRRFGYQVVPQYISLCRPHRSFVKSIGELRL
jgi:hypothetical protein